jgi:hypothetical protein
MRKILFILLISFLLFNFSEAVENTVGGGGEFTLGDLENLIRNVGIAAAVLMIVIGGFQWMTSAGDPGKISAAKERIFAAILGLIIIALASIIAALVGAPTPTVPGLPGTGR